MIIIRLKGGLGNQLFGYALGRSLSSKGHVVKFDCLTGFERDFKYGRTFELDWLLDNKEKLNNKMFISRFISYIFFKMIKFTKVCYIDNSEARFDLDILNLSKNKLYYLDGYWFSEEYFKDLNHLLKKELKEKFRNSFREFTFNTPKINEIAVHIRIYERSNVEHELKNYYKFLNMALNKMGKSKKSKLTVFTNLPELIKPLFSIQFSNITFSEAQMSPIEDMIQISKYKYVIGSYSTYSWWALYLAESNQAKVYLPIENINHREFKWGFQGLVPDRWRCELEKENS